eukprot:1275832-Alexandrium_andersonii.AAC.1
MQATDEVHFNIASPASVKSHGSPSHYTCVSGSEMSTTPDSSYSGSCSGSTSAPDGVRQEEEPDWGK